MAKKKNPNRFKSSQRSSRNRGFSAWIDQNFFWASLGFIAFWYLLWLVIFGVGFFEWDFMNSAMSWATSDAKFGGGQQAAVFTLLSLLFNTHAGILLYELFISASLVALIWYSVLVLRKTGIKQRWLWILMSFYCLFPEFIYIAGYAGKDQFISVGILAFLVKLYSVWRFKLVNWKDLTILGLLMALNVTLKVSNTVIVLALAGLVWVMRRFWKQMIVVTLAGVFLGMGLQTVFNAVTTVEITDSTGSTAASVGTAVSVPLAFPWQFQAVGNIFSNPNANITPKAKAYYDSTMSPEFWTHYNPFISDVMVRYGLPDAKPVGDNDFWNLCFSNFGDCMIGWFKLESWMILPKDILRPLWRPDDASVRPYFIGNFNPTSVPTFNTNEHICMGLSEGFTKEDLKNCIMTNYGTDESRASAFVDSWSPFIRADITTGRPIPALTEGMYNLMNSGTILMDGFWLFWATLVLFIIAIIKRNYRKLIPLLLVPISIYGSLVFYGFNTMERYLFPIYYCVPFLIVIFVAHKQNLANRKSKNK
jgi:hypothetical protein